MWPLLVGALGLWWLLSDSSSSAPPAQHLELLQELNGLVAAVFGGEDWSAPGGAVFGEPLGFGNEMPAGAYVMNKNNAGLAVWATAPRDVTGTGFMQREWLFTRPATQPGGDFVLVLRAPASK